MLLHRKFLSATEVISLYTILQRPYKTIQSEAFPQYLLKINCCFGGDTNVH